MCTPAIMISGNANESLHDIWAELMLGPSRGSLYSCLRSVERLVRLVLLRTAPVAVSRRPRDASPRNPMKPELDQNATTAVSQDEGCRIMRVVHAGHCCDIYI